MDRLRHAPETAPALPHEEFDPSSIIAGRHDEGATLASTLLATGTPAFDVMILVADTLGPEAAKPLFHQAVEGLDFSAGVFPLFHLLKQIGILSPRAADAWCRDALAEGLLVPWDDGFGGTKALYFHGQDWLTTFPPNLQVDGSVYLNGCKSLEALPEGFRVACDLNLKGCASLHELPRSLSVGGILDLTACASLDSLPGGLKVGGGLDLSQCTALKALPDDMEVNGDLHLRGCTSLAGLPAGLDVKGRLTLTDCTSLKALPEGMKVGGSLYLNDCIFLTSLPKGLWVGNSLDMKGCTSWDGWIPDDAKVGFMISTPRHPEGIPLAAWRRLHPHGEFPNGTSTTPPKDGEA